MTTTEKIHSSLSHLSSNLVSEILSNSLVKDIPKNTEILREGQYVKVIPLVLEGLVKVFTSHEEKELLLYHIKPKESCIMSFSASLKNEPSKVFAVTEEDSSILLLPIDKVAQWVSKFSDFNTLFFQQFNMRYLDLLETIHLVLFEKMDKRLLDYLQKKVGLTGKNPLKMSHRQIANELGTAREVISRVMKKLETEGKLIQTDNSIKIL